MCGRALIVGGGLAGSRAAEDLRSAGFTGDITLIGSEAELPYDRPPLSKRFLRSENPSASSLLTSENYRRLDVKLRLHRAAVHLDVREQRLILEGGDAENYDWLILATGSRPVLLPGLITGPRILGLRTVADARALREQLRGGRRLVVIGAGFIGCEVAATARQLDVEVTVVEQLEGPLVRALGPELSSVLAAKHESMGVRFLFGSSAEGVSDDEDRVIVSLADAELEADCVLVALGARPATEWLEDGGLDLSDGVMCNSHLETSVTSVFAIGDIARYARADGDSERIEHWTNAVDQASIVAANIVADPSVRTAYDPVSYVWSDQYDLKVQMLGRRRTDGTVHTFDSPQPDRRLVLFEDGGRVIGAAASGLPGPLMNLRQLIAARVTITQALEAASELVHRVARR
jgi:3-phenylpropionate/trans-cinnamate dioxygenase ferredoxin reductase subunit